MGSLILFPDGSIQEAGSIVWRDGSTSGVGRGAPADGFRGFLRRVDYCSACSLLVRRQRLPIEHPTMSVFGGDGLDVLYVTSGTFQLDPARAGEQPLAGGLFAIRGLGARGLPEPVFAA